MIVAQVNRFFRRGFEAEQRMQIELAHLCAHDLHLRWNFFADDRFDRGLMRFVEQMPQLMLETISPPVMGGKDVPVIVVHQVAIDFGLVFELAEKLIEDALPLFGGAP